MLVWGRLDNCHSPQLKKWAAGRSEKDGVYKIVKKYKNHVTLCASINSLKLYDFRHFWTDDLEAMIEIKPKL